VQACTLRVRWKRSASVASTSSFHSYRGSLGSRFLSAGEARHGATNRQQIWLVKFSSAVSTPANHGARENVRQQQVLGRRGLVEGCRAEAVRHVHVHSPIAAAAPPPSTSRLTVAASPSFAAFRKASRISSWPAMTVRLWPWGPR